MKLEMYINKAFQIELHCTYFSRAQSTSKNNDVGLSFHEPSALAGDQYFFLKKFQ